MIQTYDKGAGPHGKTIYPWRIAWRVLRRWLDRERELIALRNAVGMMAEARRSDAAEYDEMREHNRTLSARIKVYEQMLAEARTIRTDPAAASADRQGDGLGLSRDALRVVMILLKHFGADAIIEPSDVLGIEGYTLHRTDLLDGRIRFRIEAPAILARTAGEQK